MVNKPPPGTSDRAAAIDGLAARIAAVGSGRSAGSDTDGQTGPLPAAEATGRSAGARGSDEPVPVPPGAEAAKARDIVYRQLAAAPRSRASLADKLRARDVSDEVATGVLDRFEQAGLIDDRAFAEMFVRSKHRERALGRRALRAELRKHGVAESDYADAVADIDSDAEAARAAELVAKRVRAAMAAGPEAARRRLLGLLARRGYGPGLASSVVEDAIAEYRDNNS